MKIEDFIIATIIGDGSIPNLSAGAKNYRWSCGHSEKQLPYLIWKVNELKKENLHTGSITKTVYKSSRYISEECICYHTKSKSSPIFNEYRKLFYPNGIKILPKIELTKEMLSIVYMDDGHLLDVSKYRKGNITPKAVFNLHSFTNEDREYFAKQFEKFDIKATCRHLNGEVAISAKSMSNFKKIIKVLPMFQYKMGPV